MNRQNSIELRPVGRLAGMTFTIPPYQRGYRWTERQVTDLLNDIDKFNADSGGFYCLQPLVVKALHDNIMERIHKAESVDDVKKLLNGEWEVIDGQQRLTTLFLIIKCLDGSNLFDITYRTRPDLNKFFDIPDNTASATDSIDHYHIHQAYLTIKKWIDKRGTALNTSGLLAKIKESVQFIWYESVEENPIKVFTRLNIGKIGLTNAELIKAMMLNSSYYHDEATRERDRLRIAMEWDAIESALNNEELWLFVKSPKDKYVTRIDMLFDIIRAKDRLSLLAGATKEERAEMTEAIGTDNYATFRYFYEYLNRRKGSPLDCRRHINSLFDVIVEWYNDVRLYHYTGFLIDQGANLASLIDKWNQAGDKDTFAAELVTDIAAKLKGCNDLNAEYDSGQKTKWKPLLLMHNVQTAINMSTVTTGTYGAAVFYRFPFNIYKTEKWDVEHIDSSTTNELSATKDRKEWLKYALLDESLCADKELTKDIIGYINGDNTKEREDKVDDKFDELRSNIENQYIREKGNISPEPLSGTQKNKPWNYVLLDSSTNRGYGNAIFPVKRRCIIGKDRGVRLEIELTNDTTEGGRQFIVKETPAASSFIPPCTRYAFTKYYNVASAGIKSWSIDDARAYRANIRETLKEYGVTDSNANE